MQVSSVQHKYAWVSFSLSYLVAGGEQARGACKLASKQAKSWFCCCCWRATGPTRPGSCWNGQVNTKGWRVCLPLLLAIVAQQMLSHSIDLYCFPKGKIARVLFSSPNETCSNGNANDNDNHHAGSDKSRLSLANWIVSTIDFCCAYKLK